MLSLRSLDDLTPCSRLLLAAAFDPRIDGEDFSIQPELDHFYFSTPVANVNSWHGIGASRRRQHERSMEKVNLHDKFGLFADYWSIRGGSEFNHFGKALT